MSQLFLLPEAISTEEHINQFFNYLLYVDRVSFHPDTLFSEYIELGSGNLTYNLEEIEIRDSLMDQCFNLVGERIYEFGANALRMYEINTNSKL